MRPGQSGSKLHPYETSPAVNGIVPRTLSIAAKCCHLEYDLQADRRPEPRIQAFFVQNDVGDSRES
jgi:hypothetical protein